jgi:hypothetical protein
MKVVPLCAGTRQDTIGYGTNTVQRHEPVHHRWREVKHV